MTTPTDFSVSDSACTRIAELLTEEPENTAFRVAVLGGGCSGFQYKFDLDDTSPTEEDIVIEKNGARVIIDETSMELLTGSELTFTQELVGSAFSITNPNATSGCGCGNSFAI